MHTLRRYVLTALAPGTGQQAGHSLQRTCDTRTTSDVKLDHTLVSSVITYAYACATRQDVTATRQDVTAVQPFLPGSGIHRLSYVHKDSALATLAPLCT
jgi:hypothetical protein